MRFTDLTLGSPAENLAWEEAYLDLCEAGSTGAMLRFYESTVKFVVVGYGNRVNTEVDTKACREAGLGVFRRISGGGTVIQGMGCLSYALFLEIASNSALASISSANNFIMERNRAAISAFLPHPASIQGHTDLAVDGRKFSGNAQRRKRNFLLFHGTILLEFDIPSVQQFLKMPSVEPAYREKRQHSQFLTNLGAERPQVKAALQSAWGAVDEALNPLPTLPKDLIAKYNSDEWNLRM